ncbi:hypothetical protein SKAU_G00015130 [Synaphobranchus kaupii]|uniref:Ig-like domain-containing protein n=1 Tax=Synaphobranchus kaupii TaxID=118154 RepID=A0A9Q1GAQ0_SYNKA|nr:hypothetical protein SKAU_G00015130 [Synaphobranchus kaupii]
MMAQGTQLWTVCLWTAVVVQSIRALTIQYPELNSNVTVDCECSGWSCQAVFWYWQPGPESPEFRFLLYHNNADKENSFDEAKYKGSRKGGTPITYSLKIFNVQESDAGCYYCQIQYLGNMQSRPGIQLQPGEKPPTTPQPPPPPKTPLPCRCRNRGINQNPQGCGYLVLWPLVGVLASLAVVLIATLFYFSRELKAFYGGLSDEAAVPVMAEVTWRQVSNVSDPGYCMLATCVL